MFNNELDILKMLQKDIDLLIARLLCVQLMDPYNMQKFS